MEKLIERLRAQAVRLALGGCILVLFLVHASDTLRVPFISRMENLAYDARLLLTMPGTLDPRIVIVDIDEKSLQAVGRWPWSRERLAVMLDRLFDEYRAALVGFDVVFAERDESSGLAVLDRLADGELAGVPGFRERLEGLRPALDNDRRFAESIRGRPVILGYYFNGEAEQAMAVRNGALPPPSFAKDIFQGRKVVFRRAVGYGANLAPLQEVAVAGGHFNPGIDSDGIVRRVPMLFDFEGAQYESLSLAMARTALGVAALEPVFEEAPFGASRNYSGLEWLQVGSRLVPVDEHVQSLVPYRSRRGGYRYVSASDVIDGRVERPEELEGRIVLVGTTAPGLFDLRATPVQEAYPGVEVHANLISGILDGTIRQKPAYTLGAEFVLMLAFGLAMVVALPLLSPVEATLATLGALVVAVAFNMWVWMSFDLVLPIASIVFMILACFVLNMSYGYFVESRGKRQLTGLFGQYVPPELVDEMAKRPDAYSLAADNRNMTVLFSDVRGFTSISEGLSPPELAELMNAFLTPMTQVIHRHRGTIDKYMGDAVMAFWGAPLEDPEHARHAIAAALEMVRRARELSYEFRKKGWAEIRIGVGINTGMMSVGNMGSEFRMAYTVMGDAVNLASRLEGLTKGYGVTVIVGEATREAVPEYLYRELDQVKVKGKDKPVTIHEPLCLIADATKELKDELKLYKQALGYYRARNWDMAELNFLSLREKSASPDLYGVYAERVAFFRGNPPPDDWDGVFRYTTK